MVTVLAGDIGGTKTILQLVAVGRAPAGREQSVIREETFSSRDFPDLALLVKTFLHTAAAALGRSPEVAMACFGIAGPVTANASELTNLGWSLSGARAAVGNNPSRRGVCASVHCSVSISAWIRA